jgi:hypothetical protein
VNSAALAIPPLITAKNDHRSVLSSLCAAAITTACLAWTTASEHHCLHTDGGHPYLTSHVMAPEHAARYALRQP